MRFPRIFGGLIAATALIAGCRDTQTEKDVTR